MQTLVNFSAGRRRSKDNILLLKMATFSVSLFWAGVFSRIMSKHKFLPTTRCVIFDASPKKQKKIFVTIQFLVLLLEKEDENTQPMTRL